MGSLEDSILIIDRVMAIALGIIVSNRLSFYKNYSIPGLYVGLRLS